MQAHVCDWNSAALPATPGIEREVDGEMGEHQESLCNTETPDRETSACLQKHKQSFWLLCCLSLNSSTGIQQLTFVIYAQTYQTVVHLCFELTRYWRGGVIGVQLGQE